MNGYTDVMIFFSPYYDIWCLAKWNYGGHDNYFENRNYLVSIYILIFPKIHGPGFSYGLKSRSNLLHLWNLNTWLFCYSFLSLFWKREHQKLQLYQYRRTLMRIQVIKKYHFIPKEIIVMLILSFRNG